MRPSLRILLQALGFLLVGLVTAVIVAVASVSQQVSFGQSVSVFDTIDDDIEDDIMRCQSTEDLSDEISAAINRACGVYSSGARVTFPTGCYPIASPGIRIEADGTLGCNGLQLVGTESTSRQNNAPQFVALDDRVGTENKDALIYVKGLISSFSIKGFIFNMANTRGEGLRMERCQFCNISDNYFTGIKGAAWSYGASDASTDVITLTQLGSSFVVGDRVELSVDDDGGAVPGGTTAFTGYWVVAKPASNQLQISATPGGSVINLTTTVSNFFVLRRSITYDSSAVNASTDTWSITNHGFVNGESIEFSTGSTPLFEGQLLSSRRFWAVNVVPNVSFQLSETPNGTAIDITSTGSSGQRITPDSYAQVSGGGNLYPKYFGNRHVETDARCLKWTIADTEPSGDGFYGMNAGRMLWNDFNCPVQVSGISEVTLNAFEGPFGPPSVGALEIADSTGNLEMTVSHNYFEGATNGPYSYTGISTTGPAIGTVYALFNRIIGTSSVHTNSGCFRVTYFPLGGHFIGNKCRGTAYCWYQTDHSDYQVGTSSTSAVILGNTCPTSSTVGLPALTSAANGASTRGIGIYQNPVQRYQYIPGGTWGWSMSDINNATSVDLGDSVMIHLRGAWDVSSFTNADREGSRYEFIAESAGRMGTALSTPWGCSTEFRNAELFGLTINRNATEQLEYRMGQVMQHWPTTQTGLTGNLSATAIFSCNLTAGVYEVCATNIITTAGSAGTMDVDLIFNDGTGSRTRTLINDISLAATSYDEKCMQVVTNGSSDIQYSTTQTGATGSPVYTLRGTVAMKQ